MAEEDEIAVPMDIRCSDQVFDIAFHPSRHDFIAAGCINGRVEVWKHGLGIDVNCRIMECNPHGASCRGLMFDSTGQVLYTISADKHFRILNDSGKEMLKFHTGDDKLNKMHMLDNNNLVTGDDSGCVKLWDLRADNIRSGSCNMEWDVHQDYVSALCWCPDKNQTLLSGSGDGTIAIYDLRKPSIKNVQRSEDQEVEISCIETIKYGKKVVCGTQDGVLLIFSWDKWGDQSDRYPGHPETVDCCIKIDERTLLTGSSDGLIRALQFHPNKLLGVLGSHDDFPVEGMRKSFDNTLLASYAHDPIIRFNDISIFYEEQGGKEEDGGEDEAMDEDGADPQAMDSASDDDSDDDDDNDEETGRGMPQLKTAAETFFDDL